MNDRLLADFERPDCAWCYGSAFELVLSMQNSQPLVYVIDDDPSIREWIAEIVGTVCMEAKLFPDAVTFFESVDCDRYGCALVDLRLPLTSGVELLRRLRQLRLPVDVIMMSAYSEIPSVVEAMKNGAVQFLEKPFTAQQLLDEINRAVNTSEQRIAVLHAGRETSRRLDTLTEKEREVLDAVVEGLPNKATAAKLGVTEKAIEDRRARMMQKMRVGSVAELVRRITQLIDAE